MLDRKFWKSAAANFVGTVAAALVIYLTGIAAGVISHTNVNTVKAIAVGVIAIATTLATAWIGAALSDYFLRRSNVKAPDDH